jgi:hypothetical protein
VWRKCDSGASLRGIVTLIAIRQGLSVLFKRRSIMMTWEEFKTWFEQRLIEMGRRPMPRYGYAEIRLVFPRYSYRTLYNDACNEKVLKRSARGRFDLREIYEWAGKKNEI